MESFCLPPLFPVLPSSATCHPSSGWMVFVSLSSLPLSCSPLPFLVSQPGKVSSMPVKNSSPNESPHTELSMNDGSGLI